MAYALIPTELKHDLNNVVVNALRRPGPGNELGINQSWLGLLAAYGCIDYRSGGGDKVARLKFPYASSGTAGYFAKYEPAGAAGNPLVKEAEIGYAFLRDVMQVHNFDDAVSDGVVIGDESIDLWTQQYKEKTKDMISIMETKLITGIGTNNDPLGLTHWVNDSSTIGSLAMASNTWLQSKTVDAAGNDLSLNHLREAMEDARDENGAEIDIIVSSSRQQNKYKQLMDGKVQYIDLKIGDLEWKAVEYDGKPWVAITQFPKDLVLGLTMSSFKLVFVLQRDKTAKGMQPLVGMDEQGFPFAIRPRDNNGVDASSAFITNYHQMYCRASWKNWRIENLGQAL